MIKHTLILNNIPVDIRWLEVDDLSTIEDDYMYYWGFEVRDQVNWIYGNIIPRLCRICDKPFKEFDLHHGIVTRGDFPKKYFLLIHTILNLVPLHRECHDQHCPSRQEVWDHNTKLYDSGLLKLWYDGLPWKRGHPPRQFE